jgi:hypothetical protein
MELINRACVKKLKWKCPVQFFARVQTTEQEGLSWSYLNVMTRQSCVRHVRNTSFQLKMYARQVLCTKVCPHARM